MSTRQAKVNAISITRSEWEWGTYIAVSVHRAGDCRVFYASARHAAPNHPISRASVRRARRALKVLKREYKLHK